MEKPEPIKICNRSHDCPVPKDECDHNKPHRGRCAPAMQCNQSLLFSECVPIVDGKYRYWHRVWCKECGGRGYTDHYEEFDVEDQE